MLDYITSYLTDTLAGVPSQEIGIYENKEEEKEGNITKSQYV